MLIRIWKPGGYGELVTRISNKLVALAMVVVTGILYHITYRRHPRLKLDEPCLLVSNHVSYIDPPLVGMCVRGNLTYFARRSLWLVPPINLILNLVGAIPVDRAKPALFAFKDTIQSLTNGRSVLMFPEGTRSPDGRIGKVRGGFALMARRANVPVVPIYLHNMHRAWPRGRSFPIFFVRIKVMLGEPVRPPAYLDPRAQDEWLAQYVERWLKMMEAKMTGVR